MLLPRLSFLLLFWLSVSTLSAQDALSRSEWITKAYALVYADEDLSEEEEVWVKEIMDAMCNCTWVEPKEKAMACGEELLKKQNLPITEEELHSMTPEQERKFMLLSPLFTAVGKCPE